MGDAKKPPLRVLPHVPKGQEPPLWPDSLSPLKEFVADVEAGKIAPTAVVIFYLDAGTRPHYWKQNCSIPEQIAFAELMKAMALEEWRG